MSAASRVWNASLMVFPVSGVEVSPLVPLLVGFLVAAATTPTGVSGAFLLMPFQLSVLGFTSPGVTPTNLLYNVISTPGSVLRYMTQRDFDRELVGAIVKGAVPGVSAGSFFRIYIFSDPARFKVFVGVMLLGLGFNLLIQSLLNAKRNGSTQPRFGFAWISVLGAGAGFFGGIYGISGGSIVAPVLAGVFRLPVGRVAPAALLATFITSVAGVLAFAAIGAATSSTSSYGPDWLLALLFGIGGAIGGNVGARLNKQVPEAWLRRVLGAIAIGVGLSYISQFL